MSQTSRRGARGAQNWETPQALYDRLDAEFGFTIDAAASSANALAGWYWDEEADGLLQDWNDEVVWCNPPFSQGQRWVRKAASSRGTAALLIPASIDTRWWYDDVLATAHEVRFILGRIRFLMNGKPAGHVLPHPVAIVIWRPGQPPRSGPRIIWGFNWPGREAGSWVSREESR